MSISAVFDDSSPGAKVKVLLMPEMLDMPSGPGVNDSGYHGDTFSRQLSNQLGSSHRDSIGSHSDCSSTGESNETNFPLGMLSVAPEASWVTMDTKICDIFSVSTCNQVIIFCMQVYCMFKFCTMTPYTALTPNFGVF